MRKYFCLDALKSKGTSKKKNTKHLKFNTLFCMSKNVQNIRIIFVHGHMENIISLKPKSGFNFDANKAECFGCWVGVGICV